MVEYTSWVFKVLFPFFIYEKLDAASSKVGTKVLSLFLDFLGYYILIQFNQYHLFKKTLAAHTRLEL